jgi:uncharacterized protein
MDHDGRTAISFQCGGVTLRGTLWIPAQQPLGTAAGNPCVILAHGLGGTCDAGLAPFAQRFAAAGLHVLCFDYRGFGASDGEPRQRFSVRAQLQDWAAAIAFARTLDGVDPARVALWGSSMSGGHVIAAAVRDGRVAAVSAQGPMMDGLAAFANVIRYGGLWQALRVTMHAKLDALLALFGRRHTIPIIGVPGSLAIMTTPDAEPGYRAITPPHWCNALTCAWMLTFAAYRPVAMAHRLPCPTLVCICERDSVAPPAAAEALVRRAGGKAEVRRYDIGHFDIYVGEGLERALTDQTAFFLRVLAR